MKSIENKIIFLGTGGGGSMVSLQQCSTAGFWVNLEGVNLYFDPGPAALYKIREAGLIPDDLKGIFVTHKHLDHTSDLNALIEAVHYQFTNQGWNYRDYTVFCPPDVYTEGYILNLHKKMPKKIIKVQAEKKYKLKHLTITTTKNLLEKPYYKKQLNQFGYQVKGEKYGFAYIPETFYRPGLFRKISEKIIILNAMAPKEEYYNQLVKTVKEISPKLILLQHWIKRAYEFGINKYARNLEKDTGIKVQAIKDGDIFDLKTKRLKD